MEQLTDNQKLILYNITKEVIVNDNPNKFLVQIIEHAGDYLNLKTRSKYQKDEGVSHNTAKKYRKNIKLFDVIFVIDND